MVGDATSDRNFELGERPPYRAFLALVNADKWRLSMAERGKKNGAKNMDTRLGALRTELNSLQVDMKNLAGDAGDVANGRVHLAIRNAENVAERAYHLAEEAAGHAVDDVETWTTDNLDSVRGSVRAQPLSAIALSVGAGALLGALFLRR
jgi:ElaB/YqjD/DUF883 family membrane-anchored ribosome-binding protein